jgi:ABC-type Co2+ transport system permease subunit
MLELTGTHTGHIIGGVIFTKSLRLVAFLLIIVLLAQLLPFDSGWVVAAAKDRQPCRVSWQETVR